MKKTINSRCVKRIYLHIIISQRTLFRSLQSLENMRVHAAYIELTFTPYLITEVLENSCHFTLLGVNLTNYTTKAMILLLY